jgi:hypothetical protein
LNWGGVLACIALTACDGSNQSAATVVDDTVVLACTGQMIEGSDREAASYLIKVHPGNQFQNSLHFYNNTEKRFTSPCESKGFSCRLLIGDDIITEQGEMAHNGQLVLSKVTQINRRTGTMMVVLDGPPLPVRTVFEGECRKGEMPEETPAKF